MQRIRGPNRAAGWLAALAFGFQPLGQAASPALKGVLGCRSITDPQARLACFDRETAALAAAGANGAAPPAVASSGPASAKATQDFGLPAGAIVAKEVAAGQRPADLSRIHAHIMQLSRAGDGRMVFTLDNGQIWLQVLEEGDLLLKPGDAVTLARGLFHSFTLQTPSGRGCKVTRIR